MGCTPKYSIKSILPVEFVLSFDLKDAYKNIDLQYIFDFYYDLIFEKTKDVEKSKQTAGFLAGVSTVYYADRGYALPQGSPICSKLFNRVLLPIDNLLYKYSLEIGLDYVRWVDDFIFSSSDCGLTLDKFVKTLDIVRNYFPISENKTYFQRKHPVYLLGHKIVGTDISEATTEELETRRQINLS